MPKLDYQIEGENLFSNLPYLTALNSVVCFENKIKISNGRNIGIPHEMPKRKKHDIVKFSENSRRRFLKMLAEVKLRDYYSPIFITTTFHNCWPSNNKNLKRTLDSFLKKIKRLDKSFQYTWRLEFQKRGAPHFHLIIFPLIHLNKHQRNRLFKKIKSAWHSYIPDFSLDSEKHSVKILKTDNARGLFQYLGKYMCKVDDVESLGYNGRRWGYSVDLNFKPIGSVKIDERFNEQLRLNIYRYLIKKIKLSEEFRIYFFTFNEVEVFLTFEEQKFLLNKTSNDMYYGLVP